MRLARQMLKRFEKNYLEMSSPGEISRIDPSRRLALILQGPAGPFFTELQAELYGRGFQVKGVLFNSADRLFNRFGESVQFSGSERAWEAWLRFELNQNRPSLIILFGSMRPAHRIARRLAESFQIPLVSLEEGYLRSGYITCELGGNNQHSPLCNWRPTNIYGTPTSGSKALNSSFFIMCFWGATYYLVRDAFSKPTDEHLFHREKEKILRLCSSWVRHGIQDLLARAPEALKRRRIKAGYIIVPLQIPHDSQIVHAARGWSSERLVEAALRALAHSDPEQELVFKLHPLDPTGHKLRKLILSRSSDMGLSARVHLFRTGKLRDFLRNASGMIVINSTSAFSALHKNIPVLVLGDAIFRHNSIVTIGTDESDINTFLKLRHVRCRDDINAFMTAVRATALLPGDFYSRQGRAVAIDEIVSRADQIASCPLTGALAV